MILKTDAQLLSKILEEKGNNPKSPGQHIPQQTQLITDYLVIWLLLFLGAHYSMFPTWEQQFLMQFISWSPWILEGMIEV